MSEVPVCLMDELLSNLDAKLRHEMRREIRMLQQRLGITMIYVTHDQVEAMTMADEIALLHAGRVEQVSPPEELYARPAMVFAAGFIGTPPMILLPLDDPEVLQWACANLADCQALLMAVWVNGRLPGRSIVRAAYFTPTILPMVAVANIWLFFYTPQIGILDRICGLFGVSSHSWLGDPATALGCLVVLATWKDAGFFMIFFLAARQGISPELEEAALIEGAGRWNNFLWPVVITNSTNTRPLTVGLSIFGTPESGVNFSVISAGTLLAVSPPPDRLPAVPTPVRPELHAFRHQVGVLAFHLGGLHAGAARGRGHQTANPATGRRSDRGRGHRAQSRFALAGAIGTHRQTPRAHSPCR